MNVKRNDIIDTLYNLSMECTHNVYIQRYGKGILVGLVMGIMQRYKVDRYRKAIHYIHKAYVASNSTFMINSKCIPDDWLPDFRELFKDKIY